MRKFKDFVCFSLLFLFILGNIVSGLKNSFCMKNENVIIFDNEYGSNFLNLLNKKINHKVCNLEQNGQVSLTDLQRKIDKNT